MPTFTYKAKDKAGNTRTGTINAPDERAAAAMIREAGGLPMEIKPAHSQQVAPSPGAASGQVQPGLRSYLVDPIWSGVSLRSLVFFYTQLATLLKAGMSLSEALASVGSRTGGRLGRIISEACENVRRGGRFSDTMLRYPRIFSTLQTSLMRAGESGGLMEQMTERIASNLGYEQSVRQKLAKVMFYPALVCIAVIFVPHISILVNGGFELFLPAA